MTGTRLYLLGPPRIERDGAPVMVDTAKAIALLAYLVLTETSQRRETLIGLLWPESDQAHGRAALRRTLSALNKALGGERLLADRDTVGLEPGARPWVDLLQFRARLAACKAHGHGAAAVCPDCLGPLGDAVALCGGDFLQGFSLRDSLGFDDWQYHQGEILRRELDGALDRLARGLAARGEVEAALDTARRRLAVDPLNEAAHCQIMALYAQAGQRPSALRQYAECARILQAELGVTPQRTTTTLYSEIAAGRIGPQLAGLAPEVSSLPAVTPSLPEQTAPERSSEETHRIVTVLFADVSARQEASQTPSPEGIVPTLRDFAREAGDIIARHGGELHSLVGGCLVAVFGVAGAHESDPERALRAALEARSSSGAAGSGPLRRPEHRRRPLCESGGRRLVSGGVIRGAGRCRAAPERERCSGRDPRRGSDLSARRARL